MDLIAAYQRESSLYFLFSPCYSFCFEKTKIFGLNWLKSYDLPKSSSPYLPLALVVTFTWWAVMDITAPNGIVLRPNHFSSNPFGSLLFLSILFFWLIRKGHNPHKRKNQLIIQLPLKFKRITSLNDRNLARCESSIKTSLKELLVNFSTKICDLRPSIAAKKSSKIRTKRRFQISCLEKVVDPYISRTPTQSSVVMTTKYFVGTRYFALRHK